MTKPTKQITAEDALLFHSEGKPGKVEINPTKPLLTQRDLSLAYSPGVAYPCLEIEKDPATAYDYTAKGNMVAVISNGTAVLGLGKLGALASKPVMEGKSVLFKRFAGIDSVDIEVDTTDAEEFINCVRYLGPSWGGINLEDIAAPECFIIEQRLKELMDIPVFHDDQHGTAIITAAGLINACHLTGRKIKDIKLVVLGAGAAGIACMELAKSLGVKHDNALLVDREGVIYKGRTKSMNQWKSAHAADTKDRTLTDALRGADVFYGLASKGAVTKEMVKHMAPRPIIFAMANPDPEITPEEVKAVRKDAIVATGRSDYPNQINNVMGFPYIFRGALDVHASEINEEMKLAAAKALAALAREEVPEEVSSAYSGRKMEYGTEYVIPVPFDPRLITTVPAAVAQAAMDTGVARKPIKDMGAYKMQLQARLDPTANMMNLVFKRLRTHPKRVIFSEGEEERVIRAAVLWRDNGYGTPILVGREKHIHEAMDRMGITSRKGIEISNARLSKKNLDSYIAYLYKRLNRKGYLERDISRLVKNDRNTFAAVKLAMGEADLMIAGLTRNYTVTLEEIQRAIDTKHGKTLFGMSMVFTERGTIFMADTAVHELPSPERMADIAIQAAEEVRCMGYHPRVALLSFSNFGNPAREKTIRIREAVAELDRRQVDFEYDGEMSAEVALDPKVMELYPFCRLSGPANVLIMPALHTANIAAGLLQELGDRTVIGPILMGLEKPAQILQMGATVSEILNLAALAAIDVIEEEERLRRIAEAKEARGTKSKKAAAGTRKLKKAPAKSRKAKKAA
ncbi:MAG: NADP-dependent malic enzyme [Alphaproteobacteria bacterium]|nr:NADP-dependent malic enzyme [Alphaproteobacteria bacterium]